MLVGVPLVVAGAAIAGHGSVVVSKSLQEFAKHKEGRGKKKWKNHNGPSEKHTNLNAKSTARENYDKMKANFAKYKAEHGGRCDKEILKWFKK